MTDAGEVRTLALQDTATLHAIVVLQRASYRVEADLIGVDAIPALSESPEALAACGETFLGIGDASRLRGAISYKREGDLVDIHRLVVDPAELRRGIATRLLDALAAREADAERWIVSTAAANAPARALYERRGFTVARELEAAGLPIVEYARPRRPEPGSLRHPCP